MTSLTCCSPIRAWPVALGLLMCAAVPLPGQVVETDSIVTVVGIVGDFATTEPVIGAFVSKEGDLVAITDEEGAFQLALPPGPHRLEVRRAGYEPKSLSFLLGDAPVIRLTIPLDPIPHELPEILVEGDRTRMIFGSKRGFYDRVREGQGYYLTRDEIERRSPRAISDLLRRIPGLEVNQQGIGPAQVRVSSRRTSCARPLIFLDGIQTEVDSPDTVANPEQIEGVEVYTRPLTVPPDFSRKGFTCGVIAIWTR